MNSRRFTARCLHWLPPEDSTPEDWVSSPRDRAAFRNGYSTDGRDYNLGFRVGRTLFAGAGAIKVAPGAH
jgi:hypothetical protein